MKKKISKNVNMTTKKCKYCDGTGIIKIGYMWNGVFFNTAEKTCEACEGKGYVEAKESVIF